MGHTMNIKIYQELYFWTILSSFSLTRRHFFLHSLRFAVSIIPSTYFYNFSGIHCSRCASFHCFAYVFFSLVSDGTTHYAEIIKTTPIIVFVLGSFFFLRVYSIRVSTRMSIFTKKKFTNAFTHRFAPLISAYLAHLCVFAKLESMFHKSNLRPNRTKEKPCSLLRRKATQTKKKFFHFSLLA